MLKIKRALLLSYFFFEFLLVRAGDSCVSHKNLHLNLYLDFIKYNVEEKLGIIPYILKKPNGVFLEIGTGGDAMAYLFSKIPQGFSPKIIASDVDSNVLNLLIQRNPSLFRYIDLKSSGPSLELRQLDATNMYGLEDNSIDGINASAVAHEIVSYAGGIEGFRKFISESFRVLKNDGVLVYRDPEGVQDRQAMVEVRLKTVPIRLFVHIFLCKFLDFDCCKFSQDRFKNKLYEKETVLFKIYKKYQSSRSVLNFDQYLCTPSTEIDFNRDYTVFMPRGLAREVERHYLTYLHQCNPLVFVKCIPQIVSDFYTVNFLAHSTAMVFHKFVEKCCKVEYLPENGLSLEGKIILEQRILKNMLALEFGIALCCKTLEAKKKLYNLLKEYDFSTDIHLIKVDRSKYLLDSRVFGLLYDRISALCDEDFFIVKAKEKIHAEWLKREGEETYIYFSVDELITEVAKVSLSLNQSDNNPLILIPISSECNNFIPRLCYNDLLDLSMQIISSEGFSIPIKEGKRIVHFQKTTLSEAKKKLHSFVSKDPQTYPNLKNFLKTIN